MQSLRGTAPLIEELPSLQLFALNMALCRTQLDFAGAKEISLETRNGRPLLLFALVELESPRLRNVVPGRATNATAVCPLNSSHVVHMFAYCI